MSDERVVIEAQNRTLLGKKAKKLRREGWVPAVIYGRTDPLHVQISRVPLRRALRTVGTTQLINLDVEGDTRTALVRDIQQHVTRGDVLHVDFLEVDMKVKITAEAQLVAVGESPAEEDGTGTAVLSARFVEIESLPDDLVAEIEVDLSRIETPDDVVYISDLPVPSGVEILTDPETVVARFEYIQAELEEEEEEEEMFAPAADDVEVIGKGKDEEEEFFEEE